VSWENLEGGQESSQHSGEAYRNRVEEYLESKESLSTGDPYSGTSDIRLTRPAHNEEKVFRVETKNTKASLADPSLLTEIARQFIDFCIGEEEFEFHIFAEDFADQPRWKNTFRDRTRKEKEVRRLYSALREKHNLTDDELERFKELDFDEFWRFLENAHVKKAGFGRLGELIAENESQERREQKWEFYIRENMPIQESGELIPNFLRISALPDRIWTLPSLTTDYEEVYDENPRYLPIWFEGTDAYSLIPPSRMEESLSKFVRSDEAVAHDFAQWVAEDEANKRFGKILLNNQLTWRGEMLQQQCKIVRHNRQYKLIFTTDSQPVQQTLEGDIRPGENRMSEQGYNVTINVKGVVGHRYGSLTVKEYDENYYMFIRTGWLFSKNGRGDDIIEGDWATDLHHWLRKNGYDQHPNHRAQLQQWLMYLRTGVKGAEKPRMSELAGIDSDQIIEFSLPAGMELPVRPPSNSSERDTLMEGEQIE